MPERDFSSHDITLLRKEADLEVLDVQEGSDEGRMSEKHEDFDVLVGYLKDLEAHYGIVIPDKIVGCLSDLEKFTKPHNRDARVIYEAFFQIFHLRRKEGRQLQGLNLSEEDLGVGLAASLLHDIGKSGPASASVRKRTLVSRLYNIESFPNGPETSIKDSLKFLFREAFLLGKGIDQAEKVRSYLLDLKNLGIEPNDLIPSFWRSHAKWTKEILSKFLDQANPVYRRITKVASSHHYFEGSNLEGIDFNDKNLSETDRKDNYLIKLLIVLDQYQGARRRGNKNSQQAEKFIKDKLEKNGLSNDAEFLEILSLVNEVEKNTATFLLGGELDAEVKK